MWLHFGWILGAGARPFLGWLDLNLIASLQRVLVHRINGECPMPRVAFVPIGMLQSVRHRVRARWMMSAGRTGWLDRSRITMGVSTVPPRR